MIDINKVGQELSSLISDLDNPGVNREELLRTIENKISHISWSTFSTTEQRANFINGLISRSNYGNLWDSLKIVKACLTKEYQFLADPSFAADNLTNEVEILEDMFHQAILQKMNVELEEQKRYAEVSKQLTNSAFQDNPAWKEIALGVDVAKGNFEVGMIESNIERFKKEMMEPVKIDRQIEMLKIQRKRGLISVTDYSYKMSELRDLHEYYMINGEIAVLTSRGIQDGLQVAKLEAESKYENASPVNRKLWDEAKMENNLEKVQLEDQLFSVKQKIDIRNNNKALADGRINEEQWRQNKAVIDSRISPLQLEEMKKRVAQTNVSGTMISNEVDQSTGFSR